jgi:hypothetical protein
MTLIGSAGPIVEKSELALALDRGENLLLTSSPDDFERLLHLVAETLPPMSRAQPVGTWVPSAMRVATRVALVWDGWLTPPPTEGIPESLESITTPACTRRSDADPRRRPLGCVADASRFRDYAWA